MNQRLPEPTEHILVVRSINEFNECEWEEKFTAPTLRGAQIKAGKWIKAQHFDCIIDRTMAVTPHVHYRNLLGSRSGASR